MMTIKNDNLFFQLKNWKNFSVYFNSTYLKLLFYILLLASCNTGSNFELDTIKTPSGWGYTITNNDQIIIKQSIIPVIQNNKSFSSKEDALKVGRLVKQKLEDNLSPTITKKDLLLLSVKI